ncbi:hypothetical protein NKG94_37680 [Micromonospora sp. M12]
MPWPCRRWSTPSAAACSTPAAPSSSPGRSAQRRPGRAGVVRCGGVSLLGTVPLGGLTDRYGPQRVWVVGLVLNAALFATYPSWAASPASSPW